MNTFPAESTAIPFGAISWALSGTSGNGVPVPFGISSTRLLPVSARNTSPTPSTAIPVGPLKVPATAVCFAGLKPICGPARKPRR